MHTLIGTSFIEFLSTNQSFSSETSYRTESGLFLEEGQDFEIKAVVQQYEAQRNGSSNCTPHQKACSEPVADASTGSPKAKAISSSSCNYYKLATTDDIKQFLSNARHDLVLIYIGQRSSRSRLDITRSCFEQLIEALSVFSALKEHILHLGYRKLELEVAPPYPHVRLLPSRASTECILFDFELCYGFRFAVKNGRSQGKSWSLRQFVVYNKTLPSQEKSQWVFFGLPVMIQYRIETLLQAHGGEASVGLFDIHLLLLTIVINMWRPYFIHLTEKVDVYREKVHLAGTSQASRPGLLDGSILVVLKSLEDQALDAKLSIQATMKTTSKLESLVTEISQGQSDKMASHDHSGIFLIQKLEDQYEELDMLIKQSMSLLQKIKGTAGTVSNFLSLANGYALENLALEARNEAIEMAKLTKSASSDTKAVKALSVITLIYLPLTVVLNFFSTGFVDKTDDGIRVLRQWWLVFAISSPLTFVTLLLWILWASRDKLWRLLMRRTCPSNESDLNDSKSPPSSSKGHESLMV